MKGAAYNISDTMDFLPPPFWMLAMGTIAFILIKVVRIFSYPESPSVHFCVSCENSTINSVVEDCPSLNKIYKPPAIWGRNGHFQSITYYLLGHTSLKRSANKRHFLQLEDGTTTTFDVFERIEQHSEGDLTLALCPGIANCSESNYIRTCVHYAQEMGYRCAVLNHLGVLADVSLTSPRIFTYGGTQEYESMVNKLLIQYPDSRLILVGFSMGANIVSKYLGLCGKNVSSRIVAGISVCQGYDAVKSIAVMHEWSGLRRLYLYLMSESIKHLLRRNKEMALTPYIKSGMVDEQQLWASTSLLSLDEHYGKKVAGFQNVDDYYKWSSSVHVLDQINVPMVFINAADDPLIPQLLWQPVKELAEKNGGFLFVLTKHGGHLGFLEGHSFSPSSITWMDRLIVELANSFVKHYGSSHQACHSV